ncbi:site-specific integrase [Idiomarina sp. HP20-50]|uniref:tyrosine-type recombinase/integrase n=1 Tax=Idiomarina sp. HP20-50 TaxID=3070813 RepID=UPI00294B1858|nr:site-specific integrase [Idiomarina sp. HP20-50]MDV6315913.1 site-specific integrase [Idiomarina sp. HP20-50]
MRIRVQKFKSGERYVFLVGEDGVPDFWVTHYVTQRLRMTKAQRTIVQYLRDIKHFRRWELLNGRDVIEEISNGKVLSLNDIDSLKEHCAYQVEALMEKPIGKVTDMGKFYLSKAKDKPTVSQRQYKTRVKRVADFLHVIGQERVKSKPLAAKLFEELEQMKKRLIDGLPKTRLNRPYVDRTGITDGAFEDFVAVSKPDSEYNPFKEPVVRLRNYLIIRIFYETGLRCSELLALRISDIGTETDSPKLVIERRHDSKDDPRSIEPTAKTLGREVFISKGLRDLLYSYVKRQRRLTNGAKKHPFIFVTHKEKKGSYQTGEPLTNRTISNVFKCLRGVNPERFAYITSHAYRHFFNDRLSAHIDEMNKMTREQVNRLELEGRTEEAKQLANENTVTEQRELEIRAELNGHSALSSGQYYLKRTAKKNATSIREKMHDLLKHKIEGS